MMMWIMTRMSSSTRTDMRMVVTTEMKQNMQLRKNAHVRRMLTTGNTLQSGALATRQHGRVWVATTQRTPTLDAWLFRLDARRLALHDWWLRTDDWRVMDWWMMDDGLMDDGLIGWWLDGLMDDGLMCWWMDGWIDGLIYDGWWIDGWWMIGLMDDGYWWWMMDDDDDDDWWLMSDDWWLMTDDCWRWW